MNWLVQYRQSLKPSYTEEPVDLFFYRPMGFVVAKSVEPFPVTPNQITTVSMILGVAAGVLYAFGRLPLTMIAGLLYLLGNVMDCADGQLARMKVFSSGLGRIIDGLGDYVSGTAVVIGMAIGYSHAFYPTPVWWVLVVASGVSGVIQSILVDNHRSRFLALVKGHDENVHDEYREFSEQFQKSKKPSGERFILGAYLAYLRLIMAIAPVKADSPVVKDRDRLIGLNKPLIRGWTCIGSSMRISLAVVASLINRPDLFFLAVLIPINIIAMILSVWQAVVDSKQGS
jgi:hypothetical protein